MIGAISSEARMFLARGPIQLERVLSVENRTKTFFKEMQYAFHPYLRFICCGKYATTTEVKYVTKSHFRPYDSVA